MRNKFVFLVVGILLFSTLATASISYRENGGAPMSLITDGNTNWNNIYSFVTGSHLNLFDYTNCQAPNEGDVLYIDSGNWACGSMPGGLSDYIYDASSSQIAYTGGATDVSWYRGLSLLGYDIEAENIEANYFCDQGQYNCFEASDVGSISIGEDLDMSGYSIKYADYVESNNFCDDSGSYCFYYDDSSYYTWLFPDYLMPSSGYLSSSGNQGYDDSSSYWLCTDSSCSSTCQVTIESGLIVGCS